MIGTKLDVKIRDCNENGLILENQSLLPWSEITAIGKCEHLGGEFVWSSYYVRTRKWPKNISVISFGFPIFQNQIQEKKNKLLRSRILQYAKLSPRLIFVKKRFPFKKESIWDYSVEEILNYDDALGAQKEREKIGRAHV